jgi:hypothetical protein
MPRPYFEHTAAHELLHALQDLELWPTTRRPNPLDDSPESKVSSELASLILDLNVEDTLQTLGFDATYSDSVRYKNSKKGLESATVPKFHNPMWCLWVLRYCKLSFTQSSRKWARLKGLYLKHAPSIAEKGEELVAIIRKHGWSNPSQALDSMIAIRDSLGLTREHVVVMDGRTRTRY